MGLFKNDEKDNEITAGVKVRVKATKEEGFVTGIENGLYIVLLDNTMMMEKYEGEELERYW